MPRTTLVLDGLWYCLCPSFSAATLNRAPSSLTTGKRIPKFHRLSVLGSSTPSPPRRCLSNLSPKPTDANILIVEDDENQNTVSGSTPDQKSLDSHDADAQNKDVRPGALLTPMERLTKPPPGVPKYFKHLPSHRLEHRLQERVARHPRVLSATQILRVLILDRHIRPEMRHYRGLIFANSDPERGSPRAVRELLKEMEENGIPADSGTLHAALQVLAVHPDYLLRQEIVRTLRDRWLPLSPAGWHYVVAGLIREHQFELALDHIEQMERKGMMVESWLHSLLIYYLCDFGEFDEVVRLMRSRTSHGLDMSSTLWLYVLDVASTAFHYETTRYIWRQRVELRYLSPDYPLCSNVLTVAARAGDTELAASVIRFLVEVNLPPQLDDYEKMVEAHAVSGSLYSGFEVLCKMHMAGIVLEHRSTRVILTHMIQNRTPPRDAWAMLKQLKASKLRVPLECAKVVLEVCEYEALDSPSVVDDGIAFYKELYALCPDRADVSVYNVLIGMCRLACNTEAGMFLVKEMAALGVIPDQGTFEHLIIMCLEADNFESGYMYFQDLLGQAVRPSEEARAEIRDLCSQSTDPFASLLKHHPQIQDGSVGCLVDEISNTHEPLDLPEPDGDSFHRSGQSRAEVQQLVSHKERRAAAKERRKRKRRREAIAKGQEEEGWLNYEPGGLIPEEQGQKSG
ncbi:pentatricopeptide repeat protein [Aspergillus sclerotiicarbonarius CBS 121057]|uniref:Pentatricopeptide repeat protein n=1 Tax=Aspergillus sclerotiicarbonarius (strain CBS 121057 / IBT 28362) TaxID=1448318 RepID=A0A319EFE1_ASPSB|nr:pentatricopeptide repeat protein [Aspergillus sclerotiicarbonarius CBS 121057]